MTLITLPISRLDSPSFFMVSLVADATLTVSDAQRLFGATLGDFHSARAGRFMAPDSAVQIPAALRRERSDLPQAARAARATRTRRRSMRLPQW